MLHGGDIYGTGEKLGIACHEVVDFSANISPLGLPEAVRAAVISELDNALHYPDVYCRKLRRAIAKRMSADNGTEIVPEMILCGSGAADIIYRLVFAMRPKRALIVHPAFVEYEAALSCVGTEIVSYRLNRNDFLIGEDILPMITEDIDMIFVCNPNNPTGTLTKKELLLTIAKRAKEAGACLVVDECFLDFVDSGSDYTMAGEALNFKNMVLLHSFTKMFAMPGLRLGYAICADKDLLSKLAQYGQSWAVSTVAESAGIAALTQPDYERRVRAYVAGERQWLYEKLEALGIAYTKSYANYILIHVPGEKKLYEKLLTYGIMIRKCENYVNLDKDYYRIAVNSREKNRHLISALAKILNRDILIS